MFGRNWVRIDNIYYHTSRVICTRRQLKLFLHDGENVHHLRFGKPDYTFTLDGSLAKDVSFSPALKNLLIRGCPLWYFEFQMSEKENV